MFNSLVKQHEIFSFGQKHFHDFPTILKITSMMLIMFHINLLSL